MTDVCRQFQASSSFVTASKCLQTYKNQNLNNSVWKINSNSGIAVSIQAGLMCRLQCEHTSLVYRLQLETESLRRFYLRASLLS